jgi:hypothetical protein
LFLTSRNIPHVYKFTVRERNAQRGLRALRQHRNVVLQRLRRDIASFREGVAPARDENIYKWGYIDKTGQMSAIDAAGKFSDALAAARIGDEKTGRWATSTDDRSTTFACTA